MFKPFEHGDESSAIYDLTLENQVDCVSLYGNLQITKDQAGLKTAKALQGFINEVVAALEKQELPEQIERQLEQDIENPFL
ncbi:hypothetical protein KTH73_11590 [Acinetobacter courvalinii]|jgi:hypothetical protein|uniref:hypothetical protein n=1 Tax=Acinetobacter TaxID=469 RepID=UPI0002D020CB|nr:MULTISPECIES: hypothetical protein [Acinetobacter]EXB47971.1 hypothetical protein J522_1517 [Acinetobacter baumannii 146457]ENX09163.1 hypothetical protein F898_00962 [Acinetobacter courvalinii]EYT19926.1 hypothetical protein J699_02066 [Acinetobacter sp. 1000160]MBJ8418153.1 hypothetical protein [Acinetobacter courvalinii]MBJ9956620.1 hypothetical protein [Acinetobacter courvalinii]